MLAVLARAGRHPTSVWWGGTVPPRPAPRAFLSTTAALLRAPTAAPPSSSTAAPAQAVYIHPTSRTGATAPILLGLLGALETSHPDVGFFRPIGGLSKLAGSPAAAAAAAAATADGAAATGAAAGDSADPHVRLLTAVCPSLVGEADAMVGVSHQAAAAALAGGVKGPDAERLLDTVLGRYEEYRSSCDSSASHGLVVAEGGHLRSVAISDATAFHAQVARTMGAPMLLVADGASGDVEDIVGMAAGAVRHVRAASAVGRAGGGWPTASPPALPPPTSPLPAPCPTTARSARCG